MADDDRQIHAMIEFIERDAHEKAREYDDEAQAAYDSEKASLVEQHKKKVALQADKDKKALDVSDRVGKARSSKVQRMKLLDERVAIVNALKEKTQTQVQGLVRDATKYKQLLADLLRQSAVSIESDATVMCRRQDEAVVKSLLQQAQSAAVAKTGIDCTLTMASEYLEDAAWGGVILRSTCGRIKCDNTLASRTEHCFAEQLPTVRFFLFNEDAKI